MGTLTILDRHGQCYRRIWCVYEIWLTFQLKHEERQYDIYTAIHPERTGQRQAVGLSDGLAAADHGDSAALDARAERFPIDRAMGAFQTVLSDAEATQPEDKQAILDSIAAGKRGQAGDDRAAYDELNQALRSKFAVLIASSLTNRGQLQDAESVLQQVTVWLVPETDPETHAGVQLISSMLKFRQRQPIQAVAFARAAQDAYLKLGDESKHASSTVQLARALDGVRKTAEAVSELESLVAKLRQLNRYPEVLAEALAYLGYFSLRSCSHKLVAPQTMKTRVLLDEALDYATSPSLRLKILDKMATCAVSKPLLDPTIIYDQIERLVEETDSRYYHAMLQLHRADYARAKGGSGAIEQMLTFLADGLSIAGKAGIPFAYDEILGLPVDHLSGRANHAHISPTFTSISGSNMPAFKKRWTRARTM